MVLVLAHHLRMLYICTKHCENIFNSLKVTEQTYNLKFTNEHNSIIHGSGLFSEHGLMIPSFMKSSPQSLNED